MNLENRLKKLEQMIRPEQAPLLMVKFDGVWTPEQQQQMDEAKAKERKIIVVKFV